MLIVRKSNNVDKHKWESRNHHTFLYSEMNTVNVLEKLPVSFFFLSLSVSL